MINKYLLCELKVGGLVLDQLLDAVKGFLVEQRLPSSVAYYNIISTCIIEK
jgi:hypothetical protein